MLEISVPTLLIDEEKVKRNINRMLAKARDHACTLRPHFKTHQSVEIGEWFRDKGVEKITVSSFDMALKFASAGWNDITVAFPVNILEISKINIIASTIDLT
ncbi:MAG: alanine racemase, partial [Bacteroidales bacterium]|nr:alanine racemase [Bacteroidales bacterium]